MTIQDQYLDTFRQTQETWADLVKSFTNDAQRTFEQPTALFRLVDPNRPSTRPSTSGRSPSKPSARWPSNWLAPPSRPARSFRSRWSR